MTKWTIGRRIAAGYAVLILLLVAPVVVGTLALRSSREDFTSALATVETRAIKGTDSLQGMDAAVVAFLSYLLRGNETAVETIDERFDAARDVDRAAARLQPDPRAGHGLDRRRAPARRAGTPPPQRGDRGQGRGARRRGGPALQRGGHPGPADAAQPRRRARRRRAQARLGDRRRRPPTPRATRSGCCSASAWPRSSLGILIAWGLARAVTRHLRDAVATLAATSTEILAATAQQASGAAEEETAIHQTTTTADEVRQTVALTTEKARAVAKDVRETADISREGRRAVDESVRGTQEARDAHGDARGADPGPQRAGAGDRRDPAHGQRAGGAVEPAQRQRRASRPPRPATRAAGSRSSRSRSSRWPSSRARRSGRSATSSARSRPPPRPP